MAFHGDIIDITFNHPDLGSGRFSPMAANSNSYDVGGFRNSDDAGMVTGNGDLVVKKNRVRAYFDCLVEDDMNIAEDAVKAAALAESNKLAEWTFSLSNGTVWRGSGVVVGDIQPDTDAGTFQLKVAAKKFKKIVG